MDQKTLFSFSSLYREGKGYFKKHFYFFFSAFLITLVISTAFSVISPNPEDAPTLGLMLVGGTIALLISLVSAFFQNYLRAKIITTTLKVIREEENNPLFKNLFVQEKGDIATTWQLFFTAILVTLFVLGGIILLIIPGIYISIRMSFAYYILIDKKLTPMEAIRESWKLTEGKVWKLFCFYFIMFFFLLVTFLAFFLTIPFMQVVHVTLYNRLIKKDEILTNPVIEN